MSPAIIEWIGYISSIVILISLTMSSIVKLRWINLLGAILFSIYGALIGAIPVAVVNFGIVLIDIYYLWLIYKDKEIFALVDANIGSDLFQHFLDSNREEIEKQIPIAEIHEGDKALYMLRDNNLAGVIIGNIDNQEMNVKLDYVTPRYRDFKLGKYYFIENIELLKQKGIQAVKASAKEKDHQAYLEKLGFEKVANSTDQYKKTL